MHRRREVERSLEAILGSGRVRRLGERPEVESGREVCPVGVEEIDRRVGGLAVGATHEWLGGPLAGPGVEGRRGRSAGWLPALTILAWVAARETSRRREADRGGLVVWVGRRVWASAWVLMRTLGRVDACVFVDARDIGERVWAVDQALRCAGVGVVVGDATGVDLSVSRRWQLGAEAGGTLGLLARPAWERDVLSASATRWVVEPVASADGMVAAPSWRVALVRARGMATDGCSWDVRWEAHDGTHAVRVASGVVDRSGPPAAGAGRPLAPTLSPRRGRQTA
jgi:protein ImuA